jgi:hypothetical protein
VHVHPVIGRQLLAVDEALLRLAKSIAGFTTLNDLVRSFRLHSVTRCHSTIWA